MKEYIIKPSTPVSSLNSEAADVRSILALDLGIGSYGIALQKRHGEGEQRQYSFPLVRSCTLPGDWASLDEVRTARRMWRTRIAHKQREKWLRTLFAQSGLSDAVLYGRQISASKVKQADGSHRYVLEKVGDYRLEREFPPKLGESARDGAPSDEAGARTVYCGAALRCLLLLGADAQNAVQGRPLMSWQVFKALHSAIQKRGYDPRVPWQRVAAPVSIDTNSKPKKGRKIDADTAIEEGAEAPAKSESELAEEKENQASEARSMTMKAIVEGLHKDSRYHYPCFWEAAQMGLWSADEPTQLGLRQSHHAHSCKWADRDDPAQALKPAAERDKYARLPAIFPRQMVEAELMALCEAAAVLLPELAGQTLNIIYGPVGMAYPTIPRRAQEQEELEKQRRASLAVLPEEQRKKFVRGKQAEWQGALSQKAPTFDNRGPSPCVLFPHRFNVAKCDLRLAKDGGIEPDSLLAAEVSFLLQLKNFRFTPEARDDTAPGGLRDAFTATELKKIFEETFRNTVVPRIQKGLSGALTKKMLCDWMGNNIGPKTTPKPGLDGKGKEIIDTPKSSGRARLSRPGLRIVKALLLSGMAPSEFKEALLDTTNDEFRPLREAIKFTKPGSNELNTDPMKGVTVGDLAGLDNLGASWQKISVRDERLEEFNEVSTQDRGARQAAISRMIGSEVNPKIRHRLTLLDQLLEDFMEPDKIPDRVVLEFAREEWLGPKRKKELMDFQNERKEQNITARMNLGAGASQKGILKLQLCEEQGHRCLFCGGNFSSPDTTSVTHGKLSFDNAHLAHIVADTKGGPRAYVNLVLACDACNRAQGTLYHADAFAQKRFPLTWDAFTGIVGGLSKMRPFKKKILCTKSEDEAAEMVQNKTALQETAWIAKLARVLVCLKFGWRLDAEGQERRIVVVTGSVTNRVATKYGLYSLLGGRERIEKLAKTKEDIETAMLKIEAADDESLQELGDKLAKDWKLKKRKGADTWDHDYLLWCFRRRLIANDDAINEKDRSDKRHHAVDAMILSFLPHWAGNPGKNLYFGLPPGRNWKDEFKTRLDRVFPEILVSEPPEIEASFYGARKIGLHTVATKRFVLREIAYSGQPIAFSLSTLKVSAQQIRDKILRDTVLAFHATNPKEGDWIEFCTKLESQGVYSGGPSVKRVRRNISKNLDEFADFSKDGSGAWRKGATNEGWYICEMRLEPVRYAVETVYVHQSKLAREKQIKAHPDYSGVVGYYVKGEWISTSEPITGIKVPLPSGIYLIRSMRTRNDQTEGMIELSSVHGAKFNPISATRLMQAGMKKHKPNDSNL